MLSLAPLRLPTRSAMEGPQTFEAAGAPRGKRVAILSGCAQPVLDPAINEATIRLLTRHGVEVVLPQGEGCCHEHYSYLNRGGQGDHQDLSSPGRENRGMRHACSRS